MNKIQGYIIILLLSCIAGIIATKSRSRPEINQPKKAEKATKPETPYYYNNYRSVHIPVGVMEVYKAIKNLNNELKENQSVGTPYPITVTFGPAIPDYNHKGEIVAWDVIMFEQRDVSRRYNKNEPAL